MAGTRCVAAQKQKICFVVNRLDFKTSAHSENFCVCAEQNVYLKLEMRILSRSEVVSWYRPSVPWVAKGDCDGMVVRLRILA